MEIVPFENLSVTTMTLIMGLSGHIMIEPAFLLLPITPIQVQHKRKSTKCKLPHHNVPGSILSMRHRGNTRGIVRNTSRSFKNSVTIDISTTVKNINLKLSSQSIQMCGASSLEDGIEAATHVINHCYIVQGILNRMHANQDAAKEMIQWIKERTLGGASERSTYTDKNCDKLVLRIIKKHSENTINYDVGTIPAHFDQELFNFLLMMGTDFYYHSDFSAKLDYVSNITTIMTTDVGIQNTDVAMVKEDYVDIQHVDVAMVKKDYVGIEHVDEAMVNYNYALGFEVDRNALNRLINGRDGFVSRYQNALTNCVTIELPYEISEAKAKRRKNKVPHHTFLVYRSGSITQSGPGSTLMRGAYYSFMNLIAELRPLIEYIPSA